MDLDKLLVVCTNSAGDRKLYSIQRNVDGKVWHWRHNRWEAFVEGDYLKYSNPVIYHSGDAYIAYRRKDSVLFVYIQSSVEPDIYDQLYHVYGAEMPKEIPEKIRPMAPIVRDPVSRLRPKARQDVYSKD